MRRPSPPNGTPATSPASNASVRARVSSYRPRSRTAPTGPGDVGPFASARSDERPERAQRFEPESRVQLLRPVGVVGDQKDQLGAALSRRSSRFDHDGAAQPPPTELLER